MQELRRDAAIATLLDYQHLYDCATQAARGVPDAHYQDVLRGAFRMVLILCPDLECIGY